jgi:hypothetical protein
MSNKVGRPSKIGEEYFKLRNRSGFQNYKVIIVKILK